MWYLAPDSTGAVHKVCDQSLIASCVPACMAMVARVVSSTNESYDERAARTHLTSVLPKGIGGYTATTFRANGISLENVVDALAKKSIKAMKRTIPLTAAQFSKNFSPAKPGIVGFDVTVQNGESFRHTMVCKGEISQGVYLFICPAYGIYEVAAGSIGQLQLNDQFAKGFPPATATPTGEIISLL